MSAQPASIKKQIKQLAKKLEKKEEVNESLEALAKLRGSLDVYERYEVRSLAKLYLKDPIYDEKAVQLRKFLKELRHQRKEEDKKTAAENEAKENNKRPSTSGMGNVSKKMCMSIPCEIFPVLNSSKTAKKPEPRAVEMGESRILKEKNSGAESTKDIHKKMNSERTDQKHGTSHFSKPSQIMRKCEGIPFHKIRPAFQECSSSQKLQFVKMNMHFVNEVENTFKEMTILEFEGITKLPIQFQHWYTFYNVLVNVYKKNQDICKLEELTSRIAGNMRKAENVRKTKVIDIHSGTLRRPILVPKKPSTLRST